MSPLPRPVPGATEYFYDSEFLEDGKTIAPISIGIVASDGREYYAVNKNMPLRRIRKHPWLMANVVPHLPQPKGDRILQLPDRALFDYAHPAVKPIGLIADEVRRFLLADGPPVLWGNYPSYDHVLLAQLWGPMSELPPGIPMFTRDVQQLLDWAPPGFELPRQADGAHHALADARHTRTCVQATRRAIAEHQERERG